MNATTTPAIEQADLEALAAEYEAGEQHVDVRCLRRGVYVRIENYALLALARQRQAFEAREARLREAVSGIDDDYITSEVHHPNYVLIPTAKFEQIRVALGDGGDCPAILKTPATDEAVERVADAIDAADVTYGMQLTRLVDGVSTYTLTYADGSDPLEFETTDDAYEHVRQRRRIARARAAIAALGDGK